MRLVDELFDHGRPSTRGEHLHARAFELFVVVAAMQLAWDWGVYILRIGHIVLRLGMAQYLDPSFMYGTSASLYNAALISLLLIVGYLRRFRYAYLTAFCLLHLQYSARFVLGEIPHSANLVGMGVLAIALGAVLFGSGPSMNRFAIGFSVFFTGLGYTSAAVCKLVGTGLHWSSGRHLWLWIAEKHTDTVAKLGDVPLSFMQQWALSHEWVATAFLSFGLISEALAFTMWWRRPRPFTTLAVLGLHLGIFATMGILFSHAMIFVALIGFPWGHWIDRLTSRQSTAPNSRS